MRVKVKKKKVNIGSAVYSARKKLKDIFGNIDLLDIQLTIMFKRPLIDIIKLDEYLISKYGYDITKHGSQSDFIKSKFGSKAEKVVQELI